MVEGPRDVGGVGGGPVPVAARSEGSKVAKVAIPALQAHEEPVSGSLTQHKVQSSSTMLSALTKGLLTLVQGLANLIRYGRTYSEKGAPEALLSQLDDLRKKVLQNETSTPAEKTAAFVRINEIARNVEPLVEKVDLLRLRSQLPGLDKEVKLLSDDLMTQGVALKVLLKMPSSDALGETKVDLGPSSVPQRPTVEKSVLLSDMAKQRELVETALREAETEISQGAEEPLVNRLHEAVSKLGALTDPASIEKLRQDVTSLTAAIKVMRLAAADIKNDATPISILSPKAERLQGAVENLRRLYQEGKDPDIANVREGIKKVGNFLIYPNNKKQYLAMKLT